MALHSFTLRVSGISPSNEHYEDALHNAGCTDGLIAVINGAVVIDFDREAPSYDLAVQSATRAVENAGGRVIGIEPIWERRRNPKTRRAASPAREAAPS